MWVRSVTCGKVGMVLIADVLGLSVGGLIEEISVSAVRGNA
jgi:hypothetical protein